MSWGLINSSRPFSNAIVVFALTMASGMSFHMFTARCGKLYFPTSSLNFSTYIFMLLPLVSGASGPRNLSLNKIKFSHTGGSYFPERILYISMRTLYLLYIDHTLPPIQIMDLSDMWALPQMISNLSILCCKQSITVLLFLTGFLSKFDC